MKKSYESNQDLFMLFIDYKQVFDYIIKGQQWKDLETLIKLIRLIRLCI